MDSLERLRANVHQIENNGKDQSFKIKTKVCLFNHLKNYFTNIHAAHL